MIEDVEKERKIDLRLGNANDIEDKTKIIIFHHYFHWFLFVTITSIFNLILLETKLF